MLSIDQLIYERLSNSPVKKRIGKYNNETFTGRTTGACSRVSKNHPNPPPFVAFNISKEIQNRAKLFSSVAL